jgi:hypothetical protein
MCLKKEYLNKKLRDKFTIIYEGPFIIYDITKKNIEGDTYEIIHLENNKIRFSPPNHLKLVQEPEEVLEAYIDREHKTKSYLVKFHTYKYWLEEHLVPKILISEFRKKEQIKESEIRTIKNYEIERELKENKFNFKLWKEDEDRRRKEKKENLDKNFKVRLEKKKNELKEEEEILQQDEEDEFKMLEEEQENKQTRKYRKRKVLESEEESQSNKRKKKEIKINNIIKQQNQPKRKRGRPKINKSNNEKDEDLNATKF